MTFDRRIKRRCSDARRNASDNDKRRLHSASSNFNHLLPRVRFSLRLLISSIPPIERVRWFTPSWPQTSNMAVSPVVTHTVEVPQSQTLQRAISSPLKNVTSQTSSSNGTPKPPVTSVPAPATMPATLDLAEQMNDEEKRKYVKGGSVHTHPSEALLLTLYRQEAR